MKTIRIFSCMFLMALVLPAAVQAKMISEGLAEADRYYQQGEFERAHRIYFELAKTGDYYSQHRVSQMIAQGEGVKADLTEAYAWAELATESGRDEVEKYRDSLLQRVENKAEAQRKSEKLKKNTASRHCRKKPIVKPESTIPNAVPEHICPVDKALAQHKKSKSSLFFFNPPGGSAETPRPAAQVRAHR